MRASLLPPRTIEPSSFARATDQMDEPFRPFSKPFQRRSQPDRAARQLSEAGHHVHGFDVSEAMIRLARRREPRATFEVGSFVDAVIPPCEVIIAIGEVFGYAARGTDGPAPLDSLFARWHDALRSRWPADV